MKKLVLIAAALFSCQSFADQFITIEAVPKLDRYDSDQAYFSFKPVSEFPHEACEQELFSASFLPTYTKLNRASKKSKSVTVSYFFSADSDFCSVLSVK